MPFSALPAGRQCDRTRISTRPRRPAPRWFGRAAPIVRWTTGSCRIRSSGRRLRPSVRPEALELLDEIEPSRRNVHPVLPCLCFCPGLRGEHKRQHLYVILLTRRKKVKAQDVFLSENSTIAPALRGRRCATSGDRLWRRRSGKAPVYLPQNTATTAVFSRAAIAPAVSGADASGESSTAPRKAFSASGPTIGCGAAMTTPAMR